MTFAGLVPRREKVNSSLVFCRSSLSDVAKPSELFCDVRVDRSKLAPIGSSPLGTNRDSASCDRRVISQMRRIQKPELAGPPAAVVCGMNAQQDGINAHGEPHAVGHPLANSRHTTNGKSTLAQGARPK